MPYTRTRSNRVWNKSLHNTNRIRQSD